ncbi:hypothetical protein ACFOE1_10685 [Agromyces mediolanus]|uniref:Schlafen AlbA-2 domain-containing protein n=1 Tax=Agromyces mediolanus TaxID=41986 RepID=A0A918C8N2_AGRME|nr:hypothetical protein [Agromyces mediolanus]GGR12315.1 hypothetical protein GCM10010196_00900 [Agromyces mediolanus]GLJ73345.1 hypothetical protein GCM10017583_26030 [Agromyces mediolanus]
MGAMAADDVKPSIDIGRAPLGVRAASALVEAVAASDDRVERHYLEVKSDLDLTRKNDLAKVAKFILGAANRLPAVAAAAFGGYGVMILGVAPGRIGGLPPIEVLDIDKVVAQYLGAAGPHWDVVRVPVASSDNEVLVILVDPPEDGQDPFPCRREGDGLIDGRIYIRADGETREAKSGELDLLLERGRRSTAPVVDFGVTIEGAAHPIRIDESTTLNWYIGLTRARLLSRLPRIDPQDRAKSADGLRRLSSYTVGSFVSGSNPERRTEEEYRASITEWEERVHAAWADAIDELAGRVLAGVPIRVINRTRTYFRGVQLKIHLEGAVRGISWRNTDLAATTSTLKLPEPPQEWEPQPILFTFGGEPPYLTEFARSSYVSPLEWNNSESVDLTLDIGDLRPEEVYVFDDDELVLVIPEAERVPVHGTWAITASDHHEIYRGDLGVQPGDLVDLTSHLREILER